MQSITIEKALFQAYQHIKKVDARLLLEKALQVDHAFLLTHPNQSLTSQQSEQFFHWVTQRLQGMPVAYLTGQREFYDSVFRVSQAVLIPRPETELLVDLALDLIPVDRVCKILDLGTGSGAIAISIAKHRPLSQVIAVDISLEAIEIARWNASNLQVSNVHFLLGKWFDELSHEKFDLIVTNPPYVAENDPYLQQGDLRFEPKIALSAGYDGMDCIAHIIQNAAKYLVNEGWLFIEHGYDQAEACQLLLEKARFNNIRCYTDLAGIIRVSGGQVDASS